MIGLVKDKMYPMIPDENKKEYTEYLDKRLEELYGNSVADLKWKKHKVVKCKP